MKTDVFEPPPTDCGAKLSPLAWLGSLTIFGAAALLLFGATSRLMPILAERTALEPVLLWFTLGGLGVFAPLLVAAIAMLRCEHPRDLKTTWQQRLRFRPMSRGDWIDSAVGLIVIGIFAAGGMAILQLVWKGASLHPPFMTMSPLTPNRFWILAVWLPFWVLNVMSEEILWRGVILPRQEMAFGRFAWLVNGAGWLLFHVPFGPAILLTVAPITFILPYVVQRTKNSWTGVVMHAGLNGPGFIAVAFGLV